MAARGIVKVRLKRAIPVAEQNGDRTCPVVGNSQIELAVPVEVSGSYPGRLAGYRIVNVGLKRAISFPQ